WFWDLAVYQSDVEDLSLPTQDQAGSVPEARLRGVELSGGWKQNAWSLKAVASAGDFQDKETRRQLARRAERTLRVDLDRQVGTWSFGTTARAESHRYDDVFDGVSFTTVRERVAGFAVWDVRASKTLAPGWQASLAVDNVLDNKYATTMRSPGVDYIAAGRAAFLTIRYDFSR
ncbi:MAG TPA: TonB-dependent receptor, partial [Thioalkalivibrio sp.]|nr:TonB-dependent receptor [Thioalkalivibrio sp.]